ncbi:MAG: MgtC/SapB family protein [Clostridiales bacterium]|nr:MgtC/SapB family protein [Clostridiales bacterium]
MALAEYLNSRFSMIQYMDFFARIVVACLCGACIGIERSQRLKEAGVRTHFIVCAAAALMMIVSKYGFADLIDLGGEFLDGTKGADPSRIAAQVVSGVGFLGAGVIFRNGSTIKGITTAAGIWATAGIGLAVGSGMYVLGVFTTAVIIVLQIIMHKFKLGADSLETNQLKFTVCDDGRFRQKLAAYMDEYNIQIVESEITREKEGYVTYSFLVKSGADFTLDTLYAFLNDNQEICDVQCTHVG